MQLRYVFSELGQGLRRNVSMHIAVVLTLFVSMTLVGLGVLLNQQTDIATRYLGNQLQVTVYLCRDGDANPACTGEVTDEQKERDRAGHRGQPRGRVVPLRVQGGGLREGQGALRRGPVRRPQPGDDRGRHAAVLLDHAQGPQGVRGHHQRRGRPRRRLPDPRPARDAQAALRVARRAASTARGRSRGSCCSRRCCWSPTRSGWRRSRGARRSRSCGWSAPRRSTSRCRSCSRRWSPRSSASRSPAGALGGVHVLRRRTQRIADSISFMPWIGLDDYWTAADRHRDPRAAADPGSDTPADPQIPQSLTLGPLRSGRSVTSPNRKVRPRALFPGAAVVALRLATLLPRGDRSASAYPLAARRPATTSRTSRSTSSPRSSRPRRDVEEASKAITQGRRRRWPRPSSSSPPPRPTSRPSRPHAGRRAGRSSRRPRRRTPRCRPRCRSPRPSSTQAKADVVAGQAALDAQQATVKDTVVEIYQQGSPELLAWTGYLEAQTPADLIRKMEYADTLVEDQNSLFDQLHAAEVALRAKKDEVKDAEARRRRAGRPRRAAAGQRPAPEGRGRRGRERRAARPEPGHAHRRRPREGAAPGRAGQGQGPRPSCAKLKKQEAPHQAADPRRGGRRPQRRLRRRRRRLPDAAGRRLGHLAVRLPDPPDLRLLGPARRHRLRRLLRRGRCAPPPTAR